jgi:hypothetical protein
MDQIVPQKLLIYLMVVMGNEEQMELASKDLI